MIAPFKVGDLVTSDYRYADKTSIRKITSIYPATNCGSGFVASVDGGEVCPHCGRIGVEIINVDSAWFKKVEG